MKLTEEALNLLEEVGKHYSYSSDFYLDNKITGLNVLNKTNADILVEMGLIEMKPTKLFKNKIYGHYTYTLLLTDKGREVLKFMNGNWKPILKLKIVKDEVVELEMKEGVM